MAAAHFFPKMLPNFLTVSLVGLRSVKSDEDKAGMEIARELEI